MNANDLPDQNADPVPAGHYKLGIVEVTPGAGKESGIGKLDIEYMVIDGEHRKRRVWDTISLSPKSLWMLKKWLIAIGLGSLELPIEKGADNKYVIDEDGCKAAIVESAKGAEVEAEISIREANVSKGWPEKNDISEYTAIQSTRSWNEEEGE